MRPSVFDRRRDETDSGSRRSRWRAAIRAASVQWLTDQWVPAGERRVYAYARQGLRAALKSRGFGPGDTALLPAFISSSAVCPFLDLGIGVAHYRITDTLDLRPTAVADRIRRTSPDAVLVVQYLGFADSGFREIVDAARDVGAVVIEDCARGLFSRDDAGTLLGSTGDVSLYSVRKVSRAPFGGLVVDTRNTLPEPERSVSLATELATVVKRSLTRPLPSDASASVDPPIDEVDRSYDAVDLPARIGDAARPGQLTWLALARLSPGTYVSRRRARYRTTRRALRDVPSVDVLTPPASDAVCPYGVAIRIDGGHEVRDRAYYRLRRKGLPAERFMWRIAYGDESIDGYPAARRLRDSMLVVPTPPSADPDDPSRLVDALAATTSTVR